MGCGCPQPPAYLLHVTPATLALVPPPVLVQHICVLTAPSYICSRAQSPELLAQSSVLLFNLSLKKLASSANHSHSSLPQGDFSGHPENPWPSALCHFVRLKLAVLLTGIPVSFRNGHCVRTCLVAQRLQKRWKRENKI